jgi:hypothetical protein
MEKQLIVRLKSGLELTFVPNEVRLEKSFVDVSALLNDNLFPLFIQFTHELLVSNLFLSKVPDCVLLHLKENFELKSASFCVNRNEGGFTQQSQCKFVLLILFPIPFQLQEIQTIYSKSKK